MKRRKLDRRRLAALPPAPLYRDIHPDREAVCLYGDDGKPSMTCDLPTSMMNAVRRVAKHDRVSVAELLITVLRRALDKHERGF